MDILSRHRTAHPVLFVLIFLVAGLFHMRTIQKTKVIDMLLADRENEPDLRKSHWILCGRDTL